jgi:hypothetical protein
MKISNILFLTLTLCTGCATMRKACEKVAVADDAYAKAMESMERAGLLSACSAECADTDDACRKLRTQACRIKESVLIGQEQLLRAYEVCYEDAD